MTKIKVTKRLGSTVIMISNNGGPWEAMPDVKEATYVVHPKLKSTFPSGKDLGHTQTGRVYKKNGLLTPGHQVYEAPSLTPCMDAKFEHGGTATGRLTHFRKPYDKLEQVVVDINDKEAIKKAEVDVTSGRGNYYVPSFHSDWDVDDNRSKHTEPLPRVVKTDLRAEDRNEVHIGDRTYVFEMGVEVASYLTSK